MILIVTVPEDAAADRVYSMLTNRGIDVLRFDPANFPASMSVTLAFGRTSAAHALTVAGRTVSASEIDAVWIRRPGSPAAADCVTDPSVRAYIQGEAAEVTRGLWHILDCRFFPGRPATLRFADQKTFQLSLASELGFDVPPTLVTNDPTAFLDFYREHAGRIITKPVSDSDLSTGGDTYSRYADPVSHRDVAFFRSVALCPLIAQAYVPKRVELRVTVVGDSIFAAEIHSQGSNHTRHDWRKYDLARTPHAVHELPSDVAHSCIELSRRLGLRYGAIDLILTPDDRYVFLEINPNGEYLWLEDLTGLPISEAIANELVGASVSVRGVAR